MNHAANATIDINRLIASEFIYARSGESPKLKAARIKELIDSNFSCDSARSYMRTMFDILLNTGHIGIDKRTNKPYTIQDCSKTKGIVNENDFRLLKAIRSFRDAIDNHYFKKGKKKKVASAL